MRLFLIILLFTSTCLANSELKPIFEQVAIEYQVDYKLLSKIADIESSFNPKARSKTSSARGLFQITKTTEKWLKEKCDISGDIFDAEVNTKLGACYIKINSELYLKKTGFEPDFTELYILHFWGSNTGMRFIRETTSNGSRIGCERFPRECKANHSIFFKRDEKARNLFEIYELMGNKVKNGRVL